MESLCAAPFLLLCAAGGLLSALAIGAAALVRLGVVTRYALKEEPPDEGTYSLDDSRDASND